MTYLARRQLVALGAVAALLALSACTDATSPSDPTTTYAPQFQKTYHGESGGGGGGGAVCEFPNHLSGPCVNQTLILGGTMVGQVGACVGGFGWGCAAMIGPAAVAWNVWGQTPDAAGHTGTPPYPAANGSGGGNYFGGPMAPIGGAGW